MSSTLFHVKQVDIELFTCGLSLIIDALAKHSETMIKKSENRKRGLPKLQTAAPARQELGLPNAPAAAMHLEASAPYTPLTQARHSGTTIWALAQVSTDTGFEPRGHHQNCGWPALMPFACRCMATSAMRDSAFSHTDSHDLVHVGMEIWKKS